MYPQTSRMGRVSRPLLRLHFKRASYSFIMRLFRTPHFTGLDAARDLHTVGVLGSVKYDWLTSFMPATWAPAERPAWGGAALSVEGSLDRLWANGAPPTANPTQQLPFKQK